MVVRRITSYLVHDYLILYVHYDNSLVDKSHLTQFAIRSHGIPRETNHISLGHYANPLAALCAVPVRGNKDGDGRETNHILLSTRLYHMAFHGRLITSHLVIMPIQWELCTAPLQNTSSP